MRNTAEQLYETDFYAWTRRQADALLQCQAVQLQRVHLGWQFHP